MDVLLGFVFVASGEKAVRVILSLPAPGKTRSLSLSGLIACSSFTWMACLCSFSNRQDGWKLPIDILTQDQSYSAYTTSVVAASSRAPMRFATGRRLNLIVFPSSGYPPPDRQKCQTGYNQAWS